ncbi:MAG: hypothetical protein HWQ23_28480 [Nostoc sp. JL33]|uniref:hypothetical protein n=1 Tax=Nostoc sp. JL33 TaxID=2815396 RepID=UPI0025FDD9E4|nr:hypothetical protein [Nostoc sp. JL33]MBN3874064.1 hypothetical protein [Nostoc sp. JL33]
MSRQLLQRGEPPFGFTSRLRRETRLQRWIHRNALASLRLCGSLRQALRVQQSLMGETPKTALLHRSASTLIRKLCVSPINNTNLLSSK